MKKTIEELEKEVEQIKADLEELKQNGQTEWVPEERQIYYWVDLDQMEIEYSRWDNDNNDNSRLNHKIVFKTEKEAEEWLEYLEAKEKAMNEFSQAEWEGDDMKKYHIRYRYDNEKFDVDYYYSQKTYNTPYFRTKEDAQAFIEKYKKQIKRDMGIC